MKKYKLSIIVTIYNLEKQLDRCLSSLAKQTLKEIEVLCINDGSTDNSQKIVDKYVKEKPDTFKSFIKENGGGDWGARNYGLKHVSSDYFIYVDGDDFVYPDYALKLYNAIHDNDADMSVCAMERIDEATGKTLSIDMNKYGNKIIDVDGKNSIVAFINPGPCNKVYRYSKVKNNEFKAIRGSADLIFLLDSLPKIKKIVLIPDVLYSYRMRSDSQIHNIKKHDIEIYKNEFLRIKKHYKLKSNQHLLDILDLMAFIHLGLSIMYRVSYNSENAKDIVNDMLVFLNKNFPGWKKSPFLKFSYSVKKGVKHLSLWGVNILYKMKLHMVFINIYKFMIDKLKIDVKF